MVPAPTPDPARPPAWQRWLLLGLLCGLGYGVTQRLVGLSFDGDWGGTQLFGVKPFPGSGLENLRQRQGGRATDLRADLDRLDRERQERLQQQQAAGRQAAMAERDRQEQQRQQQEDTRQRLEDLQGRTEPEVPPLPHDAPISLPPLNPPEPASPAPQAEEPAPAPQP